MLDLTRFVSGAQASSVLGALGAEVLKVEIPPGDPYREQGTESINGQSVLFMALNSGKKSVAIDFRSPLCQQSVERLLASSDFLIENARPGSLAPYGLDWESVHERHPDIVYGSISGYGDVGPAAAKGGFDLILQAESGLMSLTGSQESGPVKVGAPILDLGAGLSCALGMLAAHVERLRTGVGQLVSSSLLEFGLSALATLAASYLVSGEIPGLLGTHSPTFAPYGGFRTLDGWWVVAGTGSEDLWVRLCRTLALDRLLDDPRFGDNALRVRNRDALTEEIESVLIGERTELWLERLGEEGIPAAEVQDLAQVLAAPQVEAIGALQSLAHPQAGAYRVVGIPIRLNKKALPYASPAPILGADTRRTLVELGLSDEDVDRLVGEGVAVA